MAWSVASRSAPEFPIAQCGRAIGSSHFQDVNIFGVKVHVAKYPHLSLSTFEFLVHLARDWEPGSCTRWRVRGEETKAR